MTTVESWPIDSPEAAVITAPFGGPIALVDLLEKSRKAEQWLNDHIEELTSRHPGQWAAANEDGLVKIAPSIDSLLNAIGPLPKYGSSIATRLLDPEPKELIL